MASRRGAAASSRRSTSSWVCGTGGTCMHGGTVMAKCAAQWGGGLKPAAARGHTNRAQGHWASPFRIISITHKAHTAHAHTHTCAAHIAQNSKQRAQKHREMLPWTHCTLNKTTLANTRMHTHTQQALPTPAHAPPPASPSPPASPEPDPPPAATACPAPGTRRLRRRAAGGGEARVACVELRGGGGGHCCCGGWAPPAAAAGRRARCAGGGGKGGGRP